MFRLLILWVVIQATSRVITTADDKVKGWVISSSPGAGLHLINTDNNATVGTNQRCEPQVIAYHFRTTIKYRYATTTVHSRMKNCDTRARQLRFNVTLPDNAFITKFLVEMDGKIYRSQVKEKHQADNEYQTAVTAGIGAAKVSVSVRESNVYNVYVNVEPRGNVVFNLTYEEMLIRRLNVYNYVVTPDPGQVVDDLLVDINIQETRKLINVKVFEEEDSHRIDTNKDSSIVNKTSIKTARITYRPNRKRLISMRESGVQLHVEYDVERGSQSGDVLLMDGYFVHFFAPKSLPPLAKHVIFTLDTSGSMWGRKLEQTQDAITAILPTLREADYFSIVTFGSEVTVWTPHEQSYNFVGLRSFPATHQVNNDTIQSAIDYIQSVKAVGGTNVEGALRKSIQIVAERQYKPENISTNDIEPPALPQPIIVFLSDGIPTNGEQKYSRILAMVRMANTEIQAAIFSLAFGDEANQIFLRKLSLQNNGFSRRIYEAADASLQLQSFYKEIASPLLTNVTFVYKNLKLNKTSVTANTFHTYYDGSELVIAGKIADTADSSTSPDDKDDKFGTEIEGKNKAEIKDEDDFTIEISATGTSGARLLTNKRKMGKKKHSTAYVFDRPRGVLEKMWAFISIRQHLDKDLVGDTDNTTQPENKINHRDEALRLALKYQFVTPLTSLIVVKSDNKTNIVELNAVEEEDLGDAKEVEPFGERYQILPNLLPFLRPMPISKLPLRPSLNKPSTKYNQMSLDDITWLKKNQDALGKIVIPARHAVGGVYTIDKSVAKGNETTTPCETPDGKVGNCRHLAHCVQASFANDYEIFLNFFCAIGLKAGVCCPVVIAN